jgi:NAD(P)H-hydrate epimerase
MLTRDEVRAIDRRAIEEYSVPGVVLMENAGRGAAELLLSLAVHGRVVVCCGKGNNGGDGFVIARHLDNRRVPVRVLLFGRPEELSGDAAVNFAIIQRAGLPIATHAKTPLDLAAVRTELAGAEWVVDALFGTGLSGPVRAPFDQVITAINESGARVLAVDIPSGLDCDTGRPLGATVRARHTATFVAPKKGFVEPAAREWLGKVHVIDIGVPRCLTARESWPDGQARKSKLPLALRAQCDRAAWWRQVSNLSLQSKFQTCSHRLGRLPAWWRQVSNLSFLSKFQTCSHRLGRLPAWWRQVSNLSYLSKFQTCSHPGGQQPKRRQSGKPRPLGKPASPSSAIFPGLTPDRWSAISRRLTSFPDNPDALGP